MPDDPKPESGTPDPPKGEPLAERVGAIEAEQQRQGGILERIEQALAGGKDPKAGGSGSASPADSSGAGPTVAEQVRKGVEEIEARKAKEAEAQAAKDADSAWRKNVDERLAERRPAEPATGRKTRLQRALFGKADER